MNALNLRPEIQDSMYQKLDVMQDLDSGDLPMKDKNGLGISPIAEFGTNQTLNTSED